MPASTSTDNGYIGPAPVPLANYVDYMQALNSMRGYIDQERLRSSFSHLIVNERVLDQLGPAVNANKAIFLYGPPGNGKTVIAEGMGRAAGGDMYIPHAIDIDGQHHHDVRPREPRIARRRRSRCAVDYRECAARPPLGPRPPAGRDGGR